MKKHKVVTVTIKVDVDRDVWQQCYGLSETGLAVDEDISTHVTATVREAATEAINRIGAGAEVLAS